MVPWQDEIVEHGGRRLHALTLGPVTAPAVVLLHGGSAHAHWWDLLAPVLAEPWRVVAFDLRGHGDSGHVVPPAYRLADYVADVAVVADAFGLQTFHLIGHSMGGMIAASFAAAHAARLRSLTVVDTQLHFSEAAVRYLRRLANFPQTTYPDETTALQRFRLLPTQTNATSAVIAQMAAHAYCQRSDQRWVLKFDRAALMQMEPIDLVEPLAAIATPLLIVRGAHSTVVSHTRLAALQSELPRAQVAEIPDAHHHVMLDNPAEFAAAVKKFLQTCEPRDHQG